MADLPIRRRFAPGDAHAPDGIVDPGWPSPW